MSIVEQFCYTTNVFEPIQDQRTFEFPHKIGNALVFRNGVLLKQENYLDNDAGITTSIFNTKKDTIVAINNSILWYQNPQPFTREVKVIANSEEFETNSVFTDRAYLIFVNGIMISSSEYNIVGKTVYLLQKVRNATIEVIKYYINLNKVSAANIVSTEILSQGAGVYEYPINIEPKSFELFVNGVLLSKGKSSTDFVNDYYASSTNYLLVNDIKNFTSIINQVQFAFDCDANQGGTLTTTQAPFFPDDYQGESWTTTTTQRIYGPNEWRPRPRTFDQIEEDLDKGKKRFIVRLRKGSTSGTVIANSQVVIIRTMSSDTPIGQILTVPTISGQIKTVNRRGFLNRTIASPAVPESSVNFAICPEDPLYIKVIGNDTGIVYGGGENSPYSADSDMNAVAVHSGQLKVGEKGIIKRQLVKFYSADGGRNDVFRGSTINGVTSYNRREGCGFYLEAMARATSTSTTTTRSPTATLRLYNYDTNTELTGVPLSVPEGSKVRIKLSTTGVPANTNIPFTVTGVVAGDISTTMSESWSAPIIATDLSLSTMTGTFTQSSNNGLPVYVANNQQFYDDLVITIKEDFQSEGIESFTIALGTPFTNTSVSFNIIDSSQSTATLYVSDDVTGIQFPGGATVAASEGRTLRFTLTTTGVALGTLIPYAITGITTYDTSAPLTGNFVQNIPLGYFTVSDPVVVPILNDYDVDGVKSLIFSVVSNPNVVNTPAITVVIEDTSQPVCEFIILDNATNQPFPVGTDVNLPEVTEQDTVKVYLSAKWKPYKNDHVFPINVPYTITGTTVQQDFVNSVALSGNFVFNTGPASGVLYMNSEPITFGMNADVLTEGIEYINVNLIAAPFTGRSIQIKVVDTSIAPPKVLLTGPSCINQTLNNIFLATFDQAVTPKANFESAITQAFAAGKLTVAPGAITNITPNTVWQIVATQPGIPFAVVGSGTATMHGSAGLTRLLNQATTHVAYSTGDDSVVHYTLPFNIQFPISFSQVVEGNLITIGTNFFISLGQYYGNGYPPTLTNPGFPSIFFGTKDSGCFGIWAGSTDGNQTVVIRLEGVQFYTEGTSTAALNKIAEVVFYANDPTKFTIRTDATYWPANGGSGAVTFIKNSNTQIWPASGSINLAAGTFTTVKSVYTAYIPANVATANYAPPGQIPYENFISNEYQAVQCGTITPVQPPPAPVIASFTYAPGVLNWTINNQYDTVTIKITDGPSGFYTYPNTFPITYGSSSTGTAAGDLANNLYQPLLSTDTYVFSLEVSGAGGQDITTAPETTNQAGAANTGGKRARLRFNVGSLTPPAPQVTAFTLSPDPANETNLRTVNASWTLTDSIGSRTVSWAVTGIGTTSSADFTSITPTTHTTVQSTPANLSTVITINQDNIQNEGVEQYYFDFWVGTVQTVGQQFHREGPFSILDTWPTTNAPTTQPPTTQPPTTQPPGGGIINFTLSASCVGGLGVYEVDNLSPYPPGNYEISYTPRTTPYSPSESSDDRGPYQVTNNLQKTNLADGTYYVTVRYIIDTAFFTSKSVVISCSGTPTTQSPTTQSPTTQSPTTQSPTTQSPTTQPPGGGSNPTITISASSTGLSRNQTSTLTFTISGATTDFTVTDISMLFPYASITNFSGSGSSYTATYTPPDGVNMSNDISVAANKFTVGGLNNQASNTVTINSNCRGTNDTVQIANISYGSVAAQAVNIRFPGTAHGDEGIFLHIHGGGWAHGDKSDADNLPIEIALAESGFVVVNINYRLVTVAGSPSYSTNDGQWPNNVNDIVEVLRLCTEPNYANRDALKVNGIDYFGVVKATIDANPTKWFVGGTSAGGHLSTMGALIHGRTYNRWPRGVINLAGPNDLWDGPDNDADDKGIIQFHKDVINRIVPLTEADQKSASPRWYVDFSNWSGAILALSGAQTQWVTVTNNFDTLVPTVSMARFHYRLPSNKRRLLNVHELSPTGSPGNTWTTPGVYVHWYSTASQYAFIYNANRILANGRYNTSAPLSVSISADTMDVDMSVSSTVVFNVSPMASPGPTVYPSQPYTHYWRISQWTGSTFPNGDPVPDTRINPNTTGITNSQVTVASGTVLLNDNTDNTITVTLQNVYGTKYLAVEIYDNTSPAPHNLFAMSNTVKVVGTAAPCNLVTGQSFGLHNDSYPSPGTGGGMNFRLSDNGRWSVQGSTSIDSGAWYTGANNGDPALADAYECRVTALTLNNSIGSTEVFVFGQTFYTNGTLQGGATLPTSWETIVLQQVIALSVGSQTQAMEVSVTATIEIRKVGDASCSTSRAVSLYLSKDTAQ